MVSGTMRGSLVGDRGIPTAATKFSCTKLAILREAPIHRARRQRKAGVSTFGRLAMPAEELGGEWMR